MHASRTISSSKFSVSVPSLMSSCKNAAWFRDSIWLACTAIDERIDGHAVLDHGLAGARQLAIAALLPREVHDDRPRPHRTHRVARDEHGRALSGDERGRDDDVRLTSAPSDQLELAAVRLL